MPVTHAVVVVLTGVAVLTAQSVYRRLNPEPTCATCGTRSGHRVAGHDDRICRDFIREQRRRAQAAATASGNPPPTLPDTYGHAWTTDS
ncbi:hypothetical protein BN159_0413 [Streptomyces davaonensis JCM 4913]|uniref:Uncharacterized protein n=1 Tax=Streptomyces davaonensis (strain DSM 101723 / JCM 4913 / KCC S-0913 / 768) TaxID=1214101 RepID=K4QV37_STRDJ|nr:hypothetical protein [Streptomyces davaonensis]CCK24792.1 hypothetical protein BN159_0413 [Streptomyces davaonensis JCM 4913]